MEGGKKGSGGCFGFPSLLSRCFKEKIIVTRDDRFRLLSMNHRDFRKFRDPLLSSKSCSSTPLKYGYIEVTDRN